MKTIEQVKRLLEQGKRRKELLEFGFSKSAVTKARRQLREEKAGLGPKVPERATLTKSKTVQTLDKTSDIQQKPESVVSNVHTELLSLMAAAKMMGTEKRECCPHEKDGVCTFYAWSTQGEIPQGIGEPVCTGDEKLEWHIKPSCYFCVLCIVHLTDRVDNLKGEAIDTLLWGGRERITCDECGVKGYIAVRIKCTKCGRETFWGWFPKKD